MVVKRVLHLSQIGRLVLTDVQAFVFRVDRVIVELWGQIGAACEVRLRLGQSVQGGRGRARIVDPDT